MDLKHVVVVDDDIDVFNPVDVEWAIATRVQGDRDVMIVSNARGKPLDPSLAPTPVGVVPTTAKVGIDATIPEGVPRERYERIAYAYADSAKVADYVAGKADRPGAAGDDAMVAELAQKILDVIGKEPIYYTAIAERFSAYDFRTVARALGHLHATEKLWQDPRGRMCVRGSGFAAKPPG
jgi:2,5-furandicarboxylate decarboxylase 1